jgi:tyrosinase
MRIRKDVWRLSKINPWHPDILWYARAIGELKKRSVSDPTSWKYQAAIHETSVSPNPDKRFWSQCQHNSWYFLPWHRMYLFYFEQIIASTIVQLGGPKDWSLPYWNYSDSSNADATKLPPAFYAAATPPPVDPNDSNPLLDTTRWRGNDGKSVTVNAGQTSLKCLTEPDFIVPAAGLGFGGPVTVFHHGGGRGEPMGEVDKVPHGAIHGAVSGDMGSFDTAALDPIFWLHHANIDRLWTVWLKRNPNHKNPADPKWLMNLGFEFHDATGTIVSLKCGQVVNTQASPLSYQYEDESDPLGGRAGVVPPRRLAMAEEAIPEKVGATARPVSLTGRTASASFAVTPPTGPARMAEGAESPEIYLNLENVSGPLHPTSYSVYLNLPPDESPSQHPELLAGNMPLFGLKEASRPDEQHSGSGLHYAYRVGDIVRSLQEKGDWDPNNVRVTFVPDYEVGGRAGEPQSEVKVGQISFYRK